MEDLVLQRLTGLEQAMRRAEAKEELRGLISSYYHELLRGTRGEIYNRFWVSGEDTCLEVGASGAFHGAGNAAAFYQKDAVPGLFQVHLTGEPQLTLAQDGQSARGTWLTLGVELDAGELGCQPEDPERRKLWTSVSDDGRRYRAEWLVQKCDAVFLQQDGAWKIRSLRCYELLRSPMDRDFVDWAEERFDTDGPRLDEQFRSNLPFAPDRPPERMADEPTGGHWQYTWSARAEELPGTECGS